MMLDKISESLNLDRETLLKKVEIKPASAYLYNTKKRTPKLLTALKILYTADNKIEVEDLLSHEDKQKFEKWKQKQKKQISDAKNEVET